MLQLHDGAADQYHYHTVVVYCCCLLLVFVVVPYRLEVDGAADLLEDGLPCLSVDDEHTFSGARPLRPTELRHIIC